MATPISTSSSDGDPGPSKHATILYSSDQTPINDQSRNSLELAAPIRSPLARLGKHSYYEVPKTLFQGNSRLDQLTRSTMVRVPVHCRGLL
jgi:hypothetical protein